MTPGGIPGFDPGVMESLTGALDEIRRAAGAEEKLKAANLFASRMKETGQDLPEEAAARLRGEIAGIIGETRLALKQLAGEISCTAGQLQRLRTAAGTDRRDRGGGSRGTFV